MIERRLYKMKKNEYVAIRITWNIYVKNKKMKNEIVRRRYKANKNTNGSNQKFK